MIRVYNVGPLFTEAESKQRRYEGKRISEVLNLNNVDFELSNPIDMPASNKSEVASWEIAMEDVHRLDQADVIFFDLSNEDSGSCVALGLIMEKRMQGKKIHIYPVFHDIRLSRNSQSGLESSCGFNSMVVGILKGNDIMIFSSFEEAFRQFCADYSLSDLRLEKIENVDLMTSYACYHSFEKDENGFINDAYGLNPEEYKNFVNKCNMDEHGIHLPEWKVPMTTYMLMDGPKAVGVFKLRHYLNDGLRSGSGHIGYGIAKQYRGRGYATIGLKLMIEKARELIFEKEIFMSVHKDNPSSLQVQMKNGAYIHHEDENAYYTRIKLEK